MKIIKALMITFALSILTACEQKGLEDGNYFLLLKAGAEFST